MNVSYRRLGFCRVGYAVFVIGDNTESVARRGNEVLIRNGVFLNGTSFCTSLRFPFVFICKKKVTKGPLCLFSVVTLIFFSGSMS